MSIDRHRVDTSTQASREQHYGLSIQPRRSHDGPQALPTREVETHNLVAGDAVQQAVRSKTQAAWLTELSLPI